MSMFTSLESWFVTTEADVVALISKISAEVQVAEGEAVAALKWVAGEVPAIVDGLNTALTLATAVGLPVAAPELAAAHAAVAALDAFASVQSNAPATVANATQAVVQGYVAFQQANSAVAQAKSAAAGHAAKKGA